MKFIRKDIFPLVIPILTEQIFITSMGMVNTMMAGNLKGEAGKNVVAAIGMVDSINNIFISFFSALAIGGTVVVAQYIGRKDIKAANEAAKQSLFSGVIIATLVTILIWVLRKYLITLLFGLAQPQVMENAFSYLAITLLTYPLIAILLIANGILRGAGDTKTPAKINIGMNFANIAFTYIFLYGINISNRQFHIAFAPMGVKGAALGIGLARVMGAIFIFIVLLRGTKVIKLRNLHTFRFNLVLIKQLFYVGIPASVESLLFNIGKLITQVYIVGMGTVAIVSNSIGTSIVNMQNVPGIALSTAATTVVGQAMGRGESDKAKNSLFYMTKFAFVTLGILGALCFPIAHLIVGLYTKSPEIIDYSVKLIRLNSLTTSLWAFSFVLPAGLRGAGDGTYTMVTSILGMWIFRIGLGYIFGVIFKMGVVGVWIGMYVDWIVRGSLYYIRLKGGNWKKHVVVRPVKV